MSNKLQIPEVELPRVRRLEAAGFRAWPAASVHYDGSWLVRLTAGHPGRRLNSINPLDPSDRAQIAERLAKASRRFAAYERPVTVRVSPLTSQAIIDHLDAENWPYFSESIVMSAPMTSLPTENAIDQIPMKDVGRFVDSLLSVREFDRSMKAGLSEVLGAIDPETGLFVLEKDNTAVSTAICVHDRDLAGLFEIATRDAYMRKGNGRSIVLSALRWAEMLGARQAWLQVEADNQPALHLYQSLGFTEVYRYHYRQPPQ